MPAQLEPIKGRWYYDAQAGRNLQVTWVDEDDMLIEARFEDGRTEYYPESAWNALHLEPHDDGAPQGDGDLSDDEFRRATGWAEKSPDDFPDG